MEHTISYTNLMSLEEEEPQYSYHDDQFCNFLNASASNATR